MKFLLLLLGRGEGCDYTIGCNLCVRVFEAVDAEAATRHAAKELDEMSEVGAPGMDGYRVDRATLFQIGSESELPLNKWRQTQSEVRQAQAATENESRERADFERLQKKFGGSTR